MHFWLGRTIYWPPSCIALSLTLNRRMLHYDATRGLYKLRFSYLEAHDQKKRRRRSRCRFKCVLQVQHYIRSIQLLEYCMYLRTVSSIHLSFNPHSADQEPLFASFGGVRPLILSGCWRGSTWGGRQDIKSSSQVLNSVVHASSWC